MTDIDTVTRDTWNDPPTDEQIASVQEFLNQANFSNLIAKAKNLRDAIDELDHMVRDLVDASPRGKNVLGISVSVIRSQLDRLAADALAMQQGVIDGSTENPR